MSHDNLVCTTEFGRIPEECRLANPAIDHVLISEDLDERTTYRKLQQRYPAVCTEADIDALFDPTRAVDLYYDVVRASTEWSTRDFSIKTLAKFLGFEWRDVSQSGAASIATRALLDGIRRTARGGTTT